MERARGSAGPGEFVVTSRSQEWRDG